MFQLLFMSFYFPLAIVFIVLGLLAFGWLVVHVEHSRHFSLPKVVLSGIVGSLFIGFGIQMLLLSLGL